MCTREVRLYKKCSVVLIVVVESAVYVEDTKAKSSQSAERVLPCHVCNIV